jgi:hypothetical protein
MNRSYFYQLLLLSILILLATSGFAKSVRRQLAKAIAADDLAAVQALLPGLRRTKETAGVFRASLGYLVRKGEVGVLGPLVEAGRLGAADWSFALDAAVKAGALGVFQAVYGLREPHWERYEPAVCDVVATGSTAFLEAVLLEFPLARCKELFACAPPEMLGFLDGFAHDYGRGVFGRVPGHGPVIRLRDMVAMEDLLGLAIESGDAAEVRGLLPHVPWLPSRESLYGRAFEWIVKAGERRALALLLATGFPTKQFGLPRFELCEAGLATAIRLGHIGVVAVLAGVEACAQFSPPMRQVVRGGDLAVLAAVVRLFAGRPLVLQEALWAAAAEPGHPAALRWLVRNFAYGESLRAGGFEALHGEAIREDAPLHVGLLSRLLDFGRADDAAAEQRRLGLVYAAVAGRKWRALAAMMIGDVFPVRPAYQARSLPKMLAGLVEILQQLPRGSAEQTPEQVAAQAPMTREAFETAFEAHKDSPAVQAYLETYLQYFCSLDFPGKACDIHYWVFERSIGLPVSGWTPPLLLVFAKAAIPLSLWSDAGPQQVYAAATEAIQNHWMGI